MEDNLRIYELDYYFVDSTGPVNKMSVWFSDTIFGFDLNHAATKLQRKHLDRAESYSAIVPAGNESDYVVLWRQFGKDNSNLTLYVQNKENDEFVFYV